ncbi:MAG: winged helix-turn-helix transcriptional regulator [Phycisphaerales bacterium]|nr:winged helix-turn-helix transcriptional regulator [Phycisphaerales bacterium]
MKRKAATIERIPADVLESVAAALRVLAHPHRLRVCELLENTDLSVGQLAAELAISPAACSQHLNLMRAHGLLSCRRDGKVVYYQVAHPHARNVIHCIRDHMQA